MKVLTDKTAAELVRHLRAATTAPTRRARIVNSGGGVVADVFAARILARLESGVYQVALYDPSDSGSFTRSIGTGRLVLAETAQFAALPVGAVVLAHAVEVAREAAAVEEEAGTEEES